MEKPNAQTAETALIIPAEGNCINTNIIHEAEAATPTESGNEASNNSSLIDTTASNDENIANVATELRGEAEGFGQVARIHRAFQPKHLVQ